ncbi:MAG: hypothetical protein COB78_10805 [Hyphomicrobiales bacterium]|nr:MAG: hypothetical protein COB78_10805 [Hyphomicrobiales bacterium]
MSKSTTTRRKVLKTAPAAAVTILLGAGVASAQDDALDLDQLIEGVSRENHNDEDFARFDLSKGKINGLCAAYEFARSTMITASTASNTPNISRDDSDLNELLEQEFLRGHALMRKIAIAIGKVEAKSDYEKSCKQSVLISQLHESGFALDLSIQGVEDL